MVTLGQRLRDARKRAGLSQVEVCRELKINETTIFRWEAGLNQPGLSKVIELAVLYDIPLSELVEE